MCHLWFRLLPVHVYMKFKRGISFLSFYSVFHSPILQDDVRKTHYTDWHGECGNVFLFFFFFCDRYNRLIHLITLFCTTFIGIDLPLAPTLSSEDCCPFFMSVKRLKLIGHFPGVSVRQYTLNVWSLGKQLVLFCFESWWGKYQDSRDTKLTNFPRDRTSSALLYI